MRKGMRLRAHYRIRRRVHNEQTQRLCAARCCGSLEHNTIVLWHYTNPSTTFPPALNGIASAFAFACVLFSPYVGSARGN